VIDMSYLHKSTFQNGEQVFRKSLLVRTLKETCDKLKIEFHPPTTRVEVVNTRAIPLHTSFEQVSEGIKDTGGSVPSNLHGETRL